jgi:hypothetical protein
MIYEEISPDPVVSPNFRGQTTEAEDVVTAEAVWESVKPMTRWTHLFPLPLPPLPKKPTTRSSRLRNRYR